MTSPTERYAVFAGGCFWCMVPPFEELKGIIKIETGYTGGHVENPTYHEVCQGETGHYEAVRILYDGSVISYPKLLDTFFRHIDPTDVGGQFADRGNQYKAAIFYLNEQQREQAEEAKNFFDNMGLFGGPVQTEILPFIAFYPAEEYHQDYHKKNPVHFSLYKIGSRRQAFLDNLWRKEGNE